MWRKATPYPSAYIPAVSGARPQVSTIIISHQNGVLMNVRGGANLKEVRARIKSVQNISKITSTMKLVAASKLNKAQKIVEQSLPFRHGTQVLMEKEFPPIPLNAENKEPELDEETKEAIKKSPNHLIVTLTSDRGLCGAVNSSVVRAAKKLLELNPDNTRIITFGEKSLQGFTMDYMNKVEMSTIGISGNNLTCPAEIFQFAERVWDLDWDRLSVVHNHFINALQYTTVRRFLPSKESFLDKNRFPEFEIEEDREQLLNDYYANTFANFIYSCVIANQAIELSSRMVTMDGATTNAVDLGKKLSLKYNKERQASITTELIEITSGAAVIQENEAAKDA